MVVMSASPGIAGVAYDSAMINRKLATICALLAASCPAAFAQEAPREKPVFEVAPVPNARVPSTIDAEGRTLQLQVVEETDDPQRPGPPTTTRVPGSATYPTVTHGS